MKCWMNFIVKVKFYIGFVEVKGLFDYNYIYEIVFILEIMNKRIK